MPVNEILLFGQRRRSRNGGSGRQRWGRWERRSGNEIRFVLLFFTLGSEVEDINMVRSSFLEHGGSGKLTIFLGIKHIFPAEYYFITLKQLLRIILHILKAHFLLHMFLHLGIIQKVLLQSLNSQILLVPRHHSPCLINFEIEKIHPLYPFELVLHQHLVDQSLTLVGYRVDLLWDS